MLAEKIPCDPQVKNFCPASEKDPIPESFVCDTIRDLKLALMHLFIVLNRLLFLITHLKMLSGMEQQVIIEVTEVEQ